MISKIFLNTVFLFSVLTVFSQSDTGEKNNTKLLKVTNKIYMLQGNGGNIGLSFGNDGIFMIDDQYAEDVEQIQKDIKKVSNKPIRFLVNTHFHGDHTGGNVALAETGTVIFSQSNVRDRLHKMIKTETKKISEAALPVVTFDEDLTFHFNGEKIYVFHVHDAHTDGDAMVYFTGSNVLHTGDVFFNGKYPFIDTENGGSVKGYIAALEMATKIINEDTKIIPGHGNLGTYKDLKNTINMLQTLNNRVTSAYVNRKTEAEVLSMTDLTKTYDDQGYGSGFITTEAFLKMLYSEVKKNRASFDQIDEANKAAMKKYEQMQKEREENEKD
ncbi:MBL fold metallo-hydrolase [Aequorivita sp. F47161]|uniref:MBL fold metallo-hydrolase n=1 Tax=Aequorivita vitellina TaxID=2874475 RepID=A0A9X1QTM0_9FLAO|nr:MBL fold metallo-hydrolase [Aequorivita vitellina]MCG2417751.1 MBL fold metallo-hydrolase [Aequorivita vitellina]MCZ4319645.1 MBL fold metallo-hydrolase [Aequorivita viscosa]